MALLPKNEKAIKEAIARIIRANTSMQAKIAENIITTRIDQETRKNGLGQVVAIESEVITFWTNIFGTPNEDYSQFQLALIESKDPAFNRLEYQLLRTEQHDTNTIKRIYQIKAI